MKEAHLEEPLQRRKSSDCKWVCPYCHGIMRTSKELRSHSKNEHTKEEKRHAHSDETKRKISAIRKKWFEDHKDDTDLEQPFQRRWNRKPSYPETWMATVIKNEFLDKEYIPEMKFGLYALDFAWPHKQLCIEIDGSQHQEQSRAESDRRKDDKLRKSGWRVLRVPWKECCIDKRQWIMIMKEFIDNSAVIPFEKQYFRTQRHKMREELGIAKGKRIPESEWESRLRLLSDYDMTKFGWIATACRETALTAVQVRKTCEHFGIDYRTKHNA
jgi:very-short-patch-repair endonuclease